ncbi:sodium channel protein para [Trichonephila clavipes]|nr:sodium channel protein para [Trichonephila clavipes]
MLLYMGLSARQIVSHQKFTTIKPPRLPGSPFNIRRGSRASQFSCNWRNGRRYGDRKPLVLQTLVDAQEHLPYADDSNAVTPMSEENGAIIIPVYTNLTQHSSYTSHSSRISYNSHGDIYGKGLTKESQLSHLASICLPQLADQGPKVSRDEWWSSSMPRQPWVDPGLQKSSPGILTFGNCFLFFDL